MLVGTAITGRSVRPPTALGSAPPRPATTTTTRALRKAAPWAMSRWMPPTPTSAINSARLPRTLAVWRASSATGRSAVPAQTTSTLPTARFGRGGRGARAGADDHYSGPLVDLAFGECGGESRPSGAAHPRGEYDGVLGGQAADDGQQLLGSLAHAEDTFG